MAVNIEKMRFDIAETQRQAERNQRWETRKFLAQIVVAAAALMGGGAALGNYLAHHETPPAPTMPPQVIFQPGSIVVQTAPSPAPPQK